jgi:hypothetical protein
VPAAPAPTFTPPPAPSRHRRRPLVIGAVAAIVVVVILAAVFAFGGSKSSGRRTSRPVTASDYTLNVLFCGVDRDGFASMDGFIKNRSGDDLRFNFDVAFVDRAGHTVGHGLSDTFLNAGDSSPMGAGVKVDTAATNVTCNVTVT